jgi:S1-C subfamily serine protease
MTNNHVVDKAKSVEITTDDGKIEFASGFVDFLFG